MRHYSCVYLISSLALLLGGCFTRATPARPSAEPITCGDQSAIDVLHHDIDLSLSLEPKALAGRGRVRIKTRWATDRIVLDANLLLKEVRTDAGRLPFRLDHGRLCAKLPRPLLPGTELELNLAWDVPTDGNVPAFTKDDVWAGYQASAWMPTRQDPAQRATLALRITAAAELKVAASGRELSQTPAPDHRIVHSFLLDIPSPPFLFAFAAGRFDEAALDVDGLRLRALGPVGSDLKGALTVTAQVYGFLGGRLRFPLPTQMYTQIFVHGDAAQEGAGLSFLSASYLDDIREDPTEDWVFTHELSHQWFAWVVPCADFSDFWLNEGIATFLVAAAKEQRWGQTLYDREVRLWRVRSAKVHTDGRDMPISMSRPGASVLPPLTESKLPSRGVTYSRGALALHRLRGEIGDEPFWAGLRRYVQERAGRGARSEDLRRAMEAASGVDLQGFFARWVYAPAPEL